MIMKNEIADLIKEVRTMCGETQEEFCLRIGCSRVSLSLYETGATIPGSDKLMRVIKLRNDIIEQEGEFYIPVTC